MTCYKWKYQYLACPLCSFTWAWNVFSILAEIWQGGTFPIWWKFLQIWKTLYLKYSLIGNLFAVKLSRTCCQHWILQYVPHLHSAHILLLDGPVIDPVRWVTQYFVVWGIDLKTCNAFRPWRQTYFQPRALVHVAHSVGCPASGHWVSQC